jgi:predicted permease
VVGALLGFDHLSEGVVYDALVQQPVFFIGSFAIAAATGTKAGETVRDRIRAFFVRNPPLAAVVLGLLAPDALAPDVLVDAARLLILSVPVLGFFAVGVTLAEEAEEGQLALPRPFGPRHRLRLAPRFDRRVAAALVFRLVVAPLLLLALAAPLIDLPGPYLLLAAMPAGVNGLVVAHEYGLDLGLAASAIAWSTVVVVVVALVAGALT